MTQATTPDTRYNGWSNYETWAVGLWIDNEQSSQDYWRIETRTCWTLAGFTNRPVYFTQSEDARIQLADRLKEYFEDQAAHRLTQAKMQASVWADLLNAALSSVDWFELADSLLSDTEGYEPR